MTVPRLFTVFIKLLVCRQTSSLAGLESVDHC